MVNLKPYSSGRSYIPGKHGFLDFVFIHIPRTGGTSILKALEPYSHIKPEHFQRGGGHANVTSKKFWPYIGKRFSFCIARNPWDRLVSAYHIYKDEKKDGRKEHNFIEPFKTFKDFAMHLYEGFANYDCDRAKEHVAMERPEHCVPQLESICDFMGQLAIDFVGRFEYLQEDFDSVCQIIGIPLQRLELLNRSKHKPYWEYYDDESKEAVYKLFQIDIDFLGYAFGPTNTSDERVDESHTINWSPVIMQPTTASNQHLDKYRSLNNTLRDAKRALTS